jgi:chorismate dehydratase
MDIEDFFSGQLKTAENENRKAASVAVLDSFLVDPLVFHIDEQIKIIRDKPLASRNRLIEGLVQSALIGTLDYAKGKGSWKLFPDICVAAKGSFKTINLFFNKEIRDLSSVTVDLNDPTAVALLKIIMQEKYEISPELIELNGNLDEQLRKADAALLSGNKAFEIQQSNKIFIDLGEEWYDLTGLPFVYALWAVHEMESDRLMFEKIKSMMDDNIKNIDQTLDLVFTNKNKKDKIFSEFIKNRVIYHLGLEEREAVSEFFRYAFFFGLIEHIPELHFLNI